MSLRHKRRINYKEKGITLIALVVTIIVLLILAGISISAKSVITGILTRAGEAKTSYEHASLKEEIQMIFLGNAMKNDNNNSLKSKLKQQIRNAEITEVNGLSDVCYVKRGYTTLTVYENGDILDGQVSIWDGSSTECPEFKKENTIWNWYIYTPEQLKFLADFVNNGNALTSAQETLVTNAGYNKNDIVITENESTVYLMNDLDFGARPGAGATDEEKWETTANEAKKWTPIGIGQSSENKSFKGIFEGNNKIIKGIYVNNIAKSCGVFSTSRTIQRLTIENSYIKGGSGTGGIVGLFTGGIIEHCYNKNTTIVSTDGKYSYGGLVGQSQGIICDCGNSGTIIINGGFVYNSMRLAYSGGIVGASYGDVSNCVNDGSITVTNELNGINGIGGIVGQLTTSKNVNNCVNVGKITGGAESVGGIVGACSNNAQVTECINRGSINGHIYVGGIAGTGFKIEKCANYANITADGDVAGGIDGIVQANLQNTVSLCYNSGVVTASRYAGGINGKLGSQGKIGKITKCYNKGKVIATGDTSKAGGIAGLLASDATVTNSYYLSTIGVLYGISEIASPGDLALQNAQCHTTNVDLKTFEEFLTWVEQQ